MNISHSKLIRLIAVFKLLKACTLIVVGAGIFKLLHKDVAAMLSHWTATLGLDPDNQYIDSALSKLANISPARMKAFGLGSFVYAALFMTEGIGLWLLKRWAEWFTLVITTSLVPLEIYEIHRHSTIPKIAVLVINIAVVGYLVYRIRHQDSDPATKGGHTSEP
ncbi:MAG TPA: DUF2127 domain-containing protein [Acidobacteriaceae bacterium]|jgi:uncharacterized membrane protein (DUF2068 family)|nr:DUF2127 domain-containing protein [Acidobacteriaceae bacterium]